MGTLSVDDCCGRFVDSHPFCLIHKWLSLCVLIEEVEVEKSKECRLFDIMVCVLIEEVEMLKECRRKRCQLPNHIV